jgi:serine protease Do
VRCAMSRLRFFALAAILNLPAIGVAGTKDVKIETVPSGAQVEVNGSITCTTPCSIKVPSYYFGEKHTAFSSHGVEPIRLRITKVGYAQKTLDITTGPLHWTNLNGYHLYDYYLVTTTTFAIQLNPVHDFTGESPANESAPMVSIGSDNLSRSYCPQLHSSNCTNHGLTCVRQRVLYHVRWLGRH